MKKFFFFTMLFLSACTPTSVGTPHSYYYQYEPGKYIDLCLPENLPKIPEKPKLSKSDLINLSEEEMDKRIMRHIEDLNEHIENIEYIVIRTRKRLEYCR